MRRFALVLAALPAMLQAQSLDLTINDYGVSIGDSRTVRGLRLNFRDRNMERVDGINATIWTPRKDARGGVVNGLALGIPVTGADEINGASLALFGTGTAGRFTGLGVAGLGIGAGSDLHGIMIAGLGVGSGGRVVGINIAGLGIGSGEGTRGLSLAGLGVGSGGDIEGVSAALFGVGGGGDIRGISLAGFGVGGGGDITGLQVALMGVGGGGRVQGISLAGIGVGGGSELRGFQFGGVGVGGGGDVTGISVSVGGVGAGGTLRGLAIGGVGVGAPRMRAIAIGSAVGGHDVAGLVVAPFYFRIETGDDTDMGRVKGLTVSAMNHVKGEQFGVSLGLVNYAWEVNGVQLGLINYVASNRKGLRWLPLINRSWD